MYGPTAAEAQIGDAGLDRTVPPRWGEVLTYLQFQALGADLPRLDDLTLTMGSEHVEALFAEIQHRGGFDGVFLATFGRRRRDAVGNRQLWYLLRRDGWSYTVDGEWVMC